MKRREFITLVGGAAVAWPVVARAQQKGMPLIGYLHYASQDTTAHLLTAFRQGLGEYGFVEGRNVTIEYRCAEGRYDRLPELATELIDKHPAVIATSGGSSVALAVKNASAAIPIVFTVGVDPVEAGLVASINRPGGNLTGVPVFATEMTTKLIELIDQLVPKSASLAELVNPKNAFVANEKATAKDAARALTRQLIVVGAGMYACWRSGGDVAVCCARSEVRKGPSDWSALARRQCR